MSDRSATPPPHRRVHPSVFMFLIVPFGAMSGYLSVAVAFLLTRSGISVGQTAALVALGILPHTWKFFWAPIADATLTRKRWYLLSTGVSAAGFVAMSALPATAAMLPLLSLVVVVSNLAVTFLGMAVESLMAYDTLPEEKGRAGGWFQAGNLGGAGLGGGAGLWLAGRVPEPWMAGAVVAAVCLLCALALRSLPEPAAAHRAGGLGQNLKFAVTDLWGVIRSRAGAVALILCFLPLGSGAASGLWSALAGEWRASADTVALVTGLLAGLVAALGCLAGGWICDRMDRKWAYALFGVLQAASAAAMAVAPRTPATYVLFTTLYSFVTGLTYAGFTAFVLEAMGVGAAATKYSAYASLSNMPIYYMTVIDGWAHTQWGSRGMLLTEAGFGLLGLGLFSILVWVARFERRKVRIIVPAGTGAVLLLAGLAAAPAPARGAATVATPASGDDLRLPPGAASVVVPFELVDNRMFVDVRVNGQGPFRFILDTGGVNLVTPEVARRLKLSLRDSFPVGGAGAGQVTAWHAAVDSLALGGITLLDQEILVVPLDTIRNAIGFDRMEGLLGYELFRRLVAEVDYDRARITFTRPAAFVRPDDARALPMTLRGQVPRIRAVFDGIEADFIVDTGDRSSLTLFLPFQERHRLRQTLAPRVEAITGFGIGGPIRAAVARTSGFELAGERLKELVVRLPDSTGGAFTAADVAGSIGTGALRRFVVTFDYPDSLVWFRPGAARDEPDGFDQAGFWLAGSGDQFEILDVIRDSPAEAAGLVRGDRITSVDGVKAARLSLPELRRRLATAPPGSRLEFGVTAPREERKVVLELRDLLSARVPERTPLESFGRVVWRERVRLGAHQRVCLGETFFGPGAEIEFGLIESRYKDRIFFRTDRRIVREWELPAPGLPAGASTWARDFTDLFAEHDTLFVELYQVGEPTWGAGARAVQLEALFRKWIRRAFNPADWALATQLGIPAERFKGPPPELVCPLGGG